MCSRRRSTATIWRAAPRSTRRCSASRRWSQIERLVAIDAGEGTVLLLFQKGAASSVVLPGGLVPAHDAGGPGHFAFAIDAADLPAWEARLGGLGIAIESRVTWERGGTQPLLPRSRRPPRGARHPGSLAVVLSMQHVSGARDRDRNCGGRRRLRPAHHRCGEPRASSAVRDGAARLQRSPSDTLVLSVAWRSWPGGCPDGYRVEWRADTDRMPGSRRDLHHRHARLRHHRLSRVRQGSEAAAGDQDERRASDDRACASGRTASSK